MAESAKSADSSPHVGLFDSSRLSFFSQAEQISGRCRRSCGRNFNEFHRIEILCQDAAMSVPIRQIRKSLRTLSDRLPSPLLARSGKEQDQMKRSPLFAVAVLAVSTLFTPSASACCLLPWLDPLAWVGFYGCGGHGYAPGCGYPCCGQSVRAPYAPRVMSYPTAPACNCVGATAPATALRVERVPVTTYRAVTSYVPQTTYQTRYRYAPPAVAAYSPVYGNPLPARTMIQPGLAPSPVTPGTVYAPAPLPYGTTWGGPAAAPPIQPVPNLASPVPATDITGDHDVPVQSSVPVFQSSYTRSAPLRRVSYGVTPRPARAYRSSVR